MNAISPIAAHRPFNPLAAFERERAYSRKVEGQLARALMLLGLQADRLECAGEDVAHVRAFIRECAQ